MKLKEILLRDLKEAMKSGDTIRKNTVQLVRAAILQIEKDEKTTLDDNGIIDVISREAKKRRDALPEYEKSGRQDLIDNLKRELEILMAYLPEQMSEEELESLIKDIIIQTGAQSMRDIGKVMKAAIGSTKGKADGKLINEIAKKLLS